MQDIECIYIEMGDTLDTFARGACDRMDGIENGITKSKYYLSMY